MNFTHMMFAQHPQPLTHSLLRLVLGAVVLGLSEGVVYEMPRHVPLESLEGGYDCCKHIVLLHTTSRCFLVVLC